MVNALSFLMDVMWGRGFFFLLYGCLLVYAELYNSSIVSSVRIYMLFSIIWFLVLVVRGFSIWLVVVGGGLWIWEVLSYERKKRVLY